MDATAKATQRDHRRLLENLGFLQRLHTAKSLASVIGVSQTTWSRKMQEPWRTFCYDDLRLISSYCGVPFESLICGELGVK